MAHDPKVENWLASRRRGDLERLHKEEQEVAQLWWDTLTPEQKEIYQELLASHDGLAYLQNELIKKRLEARRRREGKE